MISVEGVGQGMIGRVAKVKIDEGEDLAFKVFWDSNLVWQHGPWAEIPIGIYLQAHQVTKDVPEFKLAGQNWAVMEWIYPDSKPENRQGITYEEFAQEKGLTRLNYLNWNNYNPHLIRLDYGGIQKNYPGRRWHDLFLSIIFYKRKLQKEGLLFWLSYVNGKNFLYIAQRLIRLILPSLNQPKTPKIS